MTPTGEQLCYTDAYARHASGTVRHVEAGEATLVVLDRTVFYPGGGGQPSDRGLLLRAADGRTWTVRGARKVDGEIVHELEPAEGDPPAVGDALADRPGLGPSPGPDAHPHRAPRPVRRGLARPRRAGDRRQHGTGPGAHGLRVRDDVGRPRRLHRGDRQRRAGAARATSTCAVLPRDEAFAIPDLIRTKVNLLPEGIAEIRIIEIVGLDLQADGGTHVANTSEVGAIRVTGYESKGRINKRIRIDAGRPAQLTGCWSSVTRSAARSTSQARGTRRAASAPNCR